LIKDELKRLALYGECDSRFEIPFKFDFNPLPDFYKLARIVCLFIELRKLSGKDIRLGVFHSETDD
jgi:hypothetical protein